MTTLPFYKRIAFALVEGSMTGLILGCSLHYLDLPHARTIAQKQELNHAEQIVKLEDLEEIILVVIEATDQTETTQ